MFNKNINMTSNKRTAMSPHHRLTANVRFLFKLSRVFGLCATFYLKRVSISEKICNWLSLLFLVVVDVFNLAMAMSTESSKALTVMAVVNYFLKVCITIQIFLVFTNPTSFAPFHKTSEILRYKLDQRKLNKTLRLLDAGLFLIILIHLMRDYLIRFSYYRSEVETSVFKEGIKHFTAASIYALYAIIQTPVLFYYGHLAIVVMLFIHLMSRFQVMIDRLTEVYRDLDSNEKIYPSFRNMTQITRLLESYHSLKEMSQELTSNLALLLFFTSSYAFSNIITNCIFFGSHYIRTKNEHRQGIYLTEIPGFGKFLMLQLIESAIICCILEPCHRMIRKDVDFCNLVSNCINIFNNTESRVWKHQCCRVLKAELTNPLKFEILGITTIDRFLIINIVATAATYAVLLLQYQADEL